MDPYLFGNREGVVVVRLCSRCASDSYLHVPPSITFQRLAVAVNGDERRAVLSAAPACNQECFHAVLEGVNPDFYRLARGARVYFVLYLILSASVESVVCRILPHYLLPDAIKHLRRPAVVWLAVDEASVMQVHVVLVQRLSEA